jgi:hypothetical protein
MVRKKWTPEIDTYVERRVGEGANYETIAGELGVTRGAIAGRRLRCKRDVEAAVDDELRAASTLESLYTRAMQGGCRWVIGDPAGSWHWCGEKIVEGPYCAEHAARSVGINPMRGERK